MSAEDTGGPAYPGKKLMHRAGYTTNEYEPTSGMTLRDYFAAKAMAIVAPQTAFNMQSNEKSEQYLARCSYAVADAMLEARK